MPCYPFQCGECGYYLPNRYVPLFQTPVDCPTCGEQMERHIGLFALETDSNFENGGRFFNKSAQEWQDRSRWKTWVKEMEAKGFHLRGNEAGKRKERHEKIGDKTSKYGPEYAKAQRLQYQQGSERRKLDIV